VTRARVKTDSASKQCFSFLCGILLKGQSHDKVGEMSVWGISRVSYETSFDSKQPKLEPKLFSILSETRRLLRLFRINIETACFGVSIEPKQRKRNRNKGKGTKINRKRRKIGEELKKK
jgi:hypothetical protein